MIATEDGLKAALSEPYHEEIAFADELDGDVMMLGAMEGDDDLAHQMDSPGQRTGGR